MTPNEIYKKFLLKVNKNDTNTNIKVPKSQFVLLFNEEKRQWLDDKTKGKESSDYIEDLEYLLEHNIPLEKISSFTLHDDFKLPENFFRRATSYSIASKKDCNNVPIVNWFIKPKDLNVLLQNAHTSPSFEYQETIALLNKNKLSVYKGDFTITEVYLTYYREPKDLDIAGYKHIDGTPSSDIEVDLDDFNIEEIINRTARNAVLNYESVEQNQLALQRQQINEQL